MKSNPPTVSSDYMPPVTHEEFVKTLQAIKLVTAPGTESACPAAYALADAVLSQVKARRDYNERRGCKQAHED